MAELLSNQKGFEANTENILFYDTDVDILVYGTDVDRRLKEVLNKVKETGLQLNKDKCHIRQPEIVYYEHITSGAGERMNQDKAQGIHDLAAPTNFTELRRTLGMINYLGRFLPGLSTTMKPITNWPKVTIA